MSTILQSKIQKRKITSKMVNCDKMARLSNFFEISSNQVRVEYEELATLTLRHLPPFDNDTHRTSQ